MFWNCGTAGRPTGWMKLQPSQTLERLARLLAKLPVPLEGDDGRDRSRETAVHPISGLIDDYRAAGAQRIEEQPVFSVN